MTQDYVPFDPAKIAINFRKYMLRKNDLEKKSYLITNIASTEQEKDTAVLGDFFRPREYIKSREYTSKWIEYWLKAPIEDIWSPKFVGLDKSGIQKLEFQNPPYVAAYRLGGDPRDYNNVFTIQVSGCDYLCSFCYVPRIANNPIKAPSKLFTANEILNYFQEIQADQGKSAPKVIRLSGGEVTSIIPEMIIDISDEIESRGLSKQIYLFADTNLSTIEFAHSIKDDLKRIAQRRNFGLIGCLKAIGNGEIGKEDFTLITGASPEHFQKQFEALDFYVNEIRADFYLYLLPIISGRKDEVSKKLEFCFSRLIEIDANLPLRANFLHVTLERYKATINNLSAAEKDKRPLPKYDEKFVLHTWYNGLLAKSYPLTLLEKYRCQIPLGGKNEHR
jgi:uncharacterized Fe-S cluster-containing radical SAM superfamily protein